jgi:hypothetical protein
MRLVLLLVLLLVLAAVVTACGARSSTHRPGHDSAVDPHRCADFRLNADAACAAPHTAKCSKRLRVQERGQPFARAHCGTLP